MQEPKVQIIVRKEDEALVRDVLGGAVAEYQAKTKLTVDAQIENTLYLPAGPETEANFWYVFTNFEMKICSIRNHF